MAVLTITPTLIQCSLVVLKGPNNERILTGTNLPTVVPGNEVYKQNTSFLPLIEAARAAASQREGWSVTTWRLTVSRNETDKRIRSIKVKTDDGELWIKGWPWYTTPDGDNQARLSTNLVQSALEAHGLQITNTYSEEINADYIDYIIKEVDNQE